MSRVGKLTQTDSSNSPTTCGNDYAGTQSLTFYAHHRKCGREAFEKTGILLVFDGTSVHGCFSSYFTYSSCVHALCNAHLLRELTAIYERDTKQQQTSSQAREMIELLREIKTGVERTQAAGGVRLEDAEREDFDARYKRLVAEGLRVNPPPPGKPGNSREVDCRYTELGRECDAGILGGEER